ncbi:hypothetical protein TMatcc_006707 [Talaromyces marneffei ATCC 18224]
MESNIETDGENVGQEDPGQSIIRFQSSPIRSTTYIGARFPKGSASRRQRCRQVSVTTIPVAHQRIQFSPATCALTREDNLIERQGALSLIRSLLTAAYLFLLV